MLEGGFDAYVEAGLMTEKDLDPDRDPADPEATPMRSTDTHLPLLFSPDPEAPHPPGQPGP